MPRPLDQLFLDALRRYPVAQRDEKFGRASSFWPLIAELKAGLEQIPALRADPDAKVKVSFGQGGWAQVPNFALMNRRETERPSAGVYVVYLMRADASGLVLSLNQGSADVIFESKGRVYGKLRGRARQVREHLELDALGAAGFTDETIELKSTSQYPRAYVAGSILAKTYALDAMPAAAELEADVAALWKAYSSVVPSQRLGLGAVRPGWR